MAEYYLGTPMDALSDEDKKRAAALTKRRQELRDYLQLVKEGGKFQIVIPDETMPVDSPGQPKMMLKMMALTEETQALAEKEIRQRIEGLEAKMKGLGLALD